MQVVLMGDGVFFYNTVLFVGFGYGLYGEEYLFVDVAKFHMAASHYPAGSVEEFCHRYIGETRSGAFGERCHEIAWETCPVDIDTYTYHCGGVEHTINACFGMVAHY